MHFTAPKLAVISLQSTVLKKKKGKFLLHKVIQTKNPKQTKNPTPKPANNHKITFEIIYKKEGSPPVGTMLLFSHL